MALKIVIWNVEHGNAISLITPNKKRIIHDLGSNANTKFSPIKYSAVKYKNNQVDALIITHPHRDHIDDIINFEESGLGSTLRHFIRPMHVNHKYLKEQRDRLKRGKVSYVDMSKYEAYFKLHDQFPNTYISKTSPLNPNNNGGVEFKFFKPNKYSLNNINNHSVVTFVNYCDKTIMLTGDNEAPSWKELLGISKFRKYLRKVDILMASHHGRENGFYPPLFEFCKPKLAIISDGPGTNTNAVRRYGGIIEDPFSVYFANQDRYKERKVLTTRKDNAIIISLDNTDTIKVKTKS